MHYPNECYIYTQESFIILVASMSTLPVQVYTNHVTTLVDWHVRYANDHIYAATNPLNVPVSAHFPIAPHM